MSEKWHVKLLLRLSSKDQAAFHALHYFSAPLGKIWELMVEELNEHKSVITVPASLNASINFTMTEELKNTYQKDH